MIEREKNTAFYTREEIITDITTGEILGETRKTVAKTTAEPDFVKVYYETMMAFNKIHDVPTSFVLSLSKFLEWTNDGKPQYTTLNKRVKEIICKDCGVSLPQVNRYIKTSVKNGLLFRTDYRGVYEVNPFMIARGKWDSIKKLRSSYDFVDGRWERIVQFADNEDEVNKQFANQQGHAMNKVDSANKEKIEENELFDKQMEISDINMNMKEAQEIRRNAIIGVGA